MAHVENVDAGAQAMRMETPLQKGSVLEEGRTRQMWVGALTSGMNSTVEQVRCSAGSNFSLLASMNSSQ